MDLVGNDSLHSEEVMRKMWTDSMNAVNCHQGRIAYDSFMLLMKGQGQTKEIIDHGQASYTRQNVSSQVINRTNPYEDLSPEKFNLFEFVSKVLDGSHPRRDWSSHQADCIGLVV